MWLPGPPLTMELWAVMRQARPMPLAAMQATHPHSYSPANWTNAGCLPVSTASTVISKPETSLRAVGRGHSRTSGRLSLGVLQVAVPPSLAAELCESQCLNCSHCSSSSSSSSHCCSHCSSGSSSSTSSSSNRVILQPPLSGQLWRCFQEAAPVVQKLPRGAGRKVKAQQRTSGSVKPRYTCLRVALRACSCTAVMMSRCLPVIDSQRMPSAR